MKNCENCGNRGREVCEACTTGNPPSMWAPGETKRANTACFNCKYSKLVDGSFDGGLLACQLSGEVHDLLRISDCEQYESKTKEEPTDDENQHTRRA